MYKFFEILVYILQLLSRIQFQNFKIHFKTKNNDERSFIIIIIITEIRLPSEIEIITIINSAILYILQYDVIIQHTS